MKYDLYREELLKFIPLLLSFNKKDIDSITFKTKKLTIASCYNGLYVCSSSFSFSNPFHRTIQSANLATSSMSNSGSLNIYFNSDGIKLICSEYNSYNSVNGQAGMSYHSSYYGNIHSNIPAVMPSSTESTLYITDKHYIVNGTMIEKDDVCTLFQEEIGSDAEYPFSILVQDIENFELAIKEFFSD